MNQLTWKDIELIGELFNKCMDKLEDEHPEYRDWGLPSDVLCKSVLEEFNRIKENNNKQIKL